ncbi:hypothetical protein Tco_0518955 [Tanacetum coccineum]
MASIVGSKSKSFMTMSIPPQDKPSINRLVESFVTETPKNPNVPSTSDRRLIELENQWSPRHSVLRENPEQAFIDYASSRTDKAGGLVSNVVASQDTRLSKFEADFKQQQSETTNKINTVLMAITDRITGALPSDTVKNPNLNAKSIALVLSTHKYVESLELGKNGSAFIQGEMPKRMEDHGLVTLPCRLGDSKPFDTLADLGSCVNIILLYLFKKLNIGLLEETDHIFGSDGVGARTPYYAKKEFMDCHLPEEWKIARDAEINPFKDVLVFRRMVEFLGARPINLKRNMWESEGLIENPINWDKPPKNGDGA